MFDITIVPEIEKRINFIKMSLKQIWCFEFVG